MRGILDLTSFRADDEAMMRIDRHLKQPDRDETDTSSLRSTARKWMRKGDPKCVYTYS